MKLELWPRKLLMTYGSHLVEMEVLWQLLLPMMKNDDVEGIEEELGCECGEGRNTVLATSYLTMNQVQ